MVALQENSQQDKADTRLLQVDPNAGSPFSKPMGSVRVAHPALICKAASHGETAPTGSLPLDHASLSLINPDVRLLHLRQIPHSEHFFFLFFQADVSLPLFKIPSFFSTRNKINGSGTQ